MFLDKFFGFIYKRYFFERIKNDALIPNFEGLVHKYIKNINDEKSDFLKRYLEVRMDNNSLVIDQMLKDISKMKHKIYLLEILHDEKDF